MALRKNLPESLIALFALLACFPASGQSQVLFLPPEKRVPIQIDSKTPIKGWLTPSRYSGEDDTSLACTRIGRGMRGTLLSRTESGAQLVIFNADDWKANCGEARGVHDFPMAWVGKEKLPSPKKIAAGDDFGDVGGAMWFSQTLNSTSDKSYYCLPRISSIKDNLEAFQDELFAGRDDVVNSGLTFDRILQFAKPCPPHGKTQSCEVDCIQRLKDIACVASPWRNKDLHERFLTILHLARPFAEKYKIDPRALACIGVVETTTLEPILKNYGACSDPLVNTSHGIGMVNATTLEDLVVRNNFISQIEPYNRAPFVASADDMSLYRSALLNAKIALKSAKSKDRCERYADDDLVQACKRVRTASDKLFQAMGTSPRLQLETAAAALSVKDGSFSDYNASKKKDPNGTEHRNNYSRAANACLSCLRNRAHQDGRPLSALDPLDCLSAAARTSDSESDNPFNLKADDSAEKAFAETKALCSQRESSGGLSAAKAFVQHAKATQ